MEYQSKELAARWNISGETLRQWSIQVAQWLSDSATPSTPGTHRRYTFADIEVLQLVSDMRGKNKSWPDIFAALDEGDRGVPEVDPAALIPLEGQRQLAFLLDTIETLKADKDELESQLQARRDEITRLTALLERSDSQLAAAREESRKELRALYEEIAILKAGKPRID